MSFESWPARLRCENSASTSDFTKPVERKSLAVYNNVKDAAISLRPTATIGTFRIQIVVGFALDARKILH
jgi:hypothetical protein